MQVDPDLLSRAIAGLYGAAYGERPWIDAVDELRRLFGGAKACLVRQGPNLGPDDAVSTDADPAFMHSYITRFSTNILGDAVDRVPVGAVYSLHELVGRDELRTSDFWNEWMAPQDMYDGLACKLVASDSSSWFFDVQRGQHQTPFDGGDAQLLSYLTPHLLRAGQIGRAVGAEQALLSGLSYLPFGVVIVQHDMAVVTMNAAAEALLSRAGSLLSLARGVLVIDPPARDLLQHHIREACRLRHGVAPGLGGDVMLRSADGPVTNLAVTVGPLAAGGRGLFVDPCAVLFVREISLGLPPGFEDQIQALFQLTPREAGLACALASGLSLRQAAAEGNIRFSTARSYLDIIFRKTATKQQSQLVALLRSTQPLIRRP